MTPTTPKIVATLQARAALAGATLQHIEADDGKPLLVLSCEAFTAQFTTLVDVRRALAELATDVEVLP